MTKSILYKILFLCCIVFWITAILLTWNKPAIGYESSIYRSTPLIFWVANITNVIVGLTLIVHRVVDKEDKQKTFLGVIGVILIFLVFASVLSLWIFRGYDLWSQHDSLTHLGVINQMINSGHFDSQNFYPITHIYVSQLSFLLGLPTNVILKCVPFILALFNIVFFYCFSKTILVTEWQAVLATIIWMTFLTEWYIDLTPNTLANFMFPLGLFLLMKSIFTKDNMWKILLTIFLFLIPLLHILVGFIMVLFMLSIWVFYIIFIRNKPKMSSNNAIFLLIAAIALLAWDIIWISSYGPLGGLVTSIIGTFSGELTSNLSSLTKSVQYAAGYHYDILTDVLKVYGGPLIILLSATSGIVFMFFKRHSNRYTNNLNLYYLPLIVVACLFIMLYLVYTGFPPERLIIYVLLICTLFAGFLFHIIFQKPGTYLTRIVQVGIVLLMIFLFIINGLKLYPSPYIYEPNMQVTFSQMDGMKWFIFNKDYSKEQTSLTVRTYRFGSLFLTPEEFSERPDMRYYTANIPSYLVIPFHFGYDVNENLGQSFRDDAYMILSQQCRTLYIDIWPEMSSLRFQSVDFMKVEEDITVNKLYSAGLGLDIYYIEAIP
jgi:hypothetical protein